MPGFWVRTLITACGLLLATWLLDGVKLGGPSSLFFAGLLVPGFLVEGFWTALLGAVVVSLTGIVANWFIGPKGQVEIIVVRH